MLQYALSEVKQIHPLLKWMVFVDDTTAFKNGRNKEMVEMVFEEVEETGREREASDGEGLEAVDR